MTTKPSFSKVRLSMGHRYQAPLVFIGMIFLMAALHLAYKWQLPIQSCILRKITGTPCPFCGSLRGLIAWSNLDIKQAFLYNPLTFLACLGIMGWFIVWISDRLFNRHWSTDLSQYIQRLPWIYILIILAILNWIYLFFCLKP